jgi:hypothetical protein
MELYDVDTFWNKLVTELGKRDFKNTITDEDEKYMDENDG